MSNVFGDSPQSQEIRVALSSLPAAPNAPYKVETLSSVTSIAVKWDLVGDTDGTPVTGYHLYMDDGYNGVFTKIFEGTNQPFTQTYTAVNLETGLPYRFKVISQNINGLSVDSAISTYYACLKPSAAPAPTKVSTTESSIKIRWQEFESNGCPITGYSILRDNGLADSVTNVVD